MARRTEVGTLSQPTLRPVANPVPVYGRTAAGQSLADLADALSDLSPRLQSLAAQKIDEEKERGRSDATSLYEDIKATGKKIKSGAIAPHESKWYQAAAREQAGRLMAASYGQDLQLAVQTDEALSESTDPQDFDSFEAGIRQKWLEEKADMDDPAFRAGFNTTSAQGILNARQSFIAAAADRMDGKVLDNTYTEHQVTIRDAITSGQSIEQMATAIHERNDRMYRVNPKLGKALSKTTIEAVFDAARAFENPELLKILDHIQGGAPGSALGQTRDALSKRDEVEREIRVNRQNRLAAEEKDEKRKRQANVDAVYDGAFDVLEADPNADVTQFAQTLSSIDRAEVPKLFRMAKAFASAANVDDRGVANGLYERAFENDLTFDEVATAFEAGQLTVKTAKDLRAQIRANRSGSGSSRAARALIQDPLYRDYAGNLEGLFFTHMGDAPNAARENANMQLKREWVAYRQTPEGAQAKEPEVLDWLQLAVERNFRRFAGVDLKEKATEAPKPDRPSNAAPGLPDWSIEPVAKWRPGQLDAMEQEWNDLTAKPQRRTSLSPATERLFLTYGIKPEEFPAFIAAQRRVSRSGTP